jgi:hypothetical protein
MEDIKGLRDTNIHDQIAFQLEWVGLMHTEAGRKVARVRGGCPLASVMLVI